jgi:hypothetical protein
MMPEASDSGLDDSLYGDEGAEESTETVESVDEEAAETPTALLPLSALGGKANVGDTVTVKVVKLHGDEVEVEIAASEESESETMEVESESEYPDMDAMMKG